MTRTSNWFSKPLFYVAAGLLFMIPVIWIARTSAFYLCYFPLIVAAILFSGTFIPEKIVVLPSSAIRCFGFVFGMIISELIFSLILVAVGELSFQFNTTPSDWLILAIELLLGIAVFLLFFAISLGARIFRRKIFLKH